MPLSQYVCLNVVCFPCLIATIFHSTSGIVSNSLGNMSLPTRKFSMGLRSSLRPRTMIDGGDSKTRLMEEDWTSVSEAVSDTERFENDFILPKTSTVSWSTSRTMRPWSTKRRTSAAIVLRRLFGSDDAIVTFTTSAIKQVITRNHREFGTMSR